MNDIHENITVPEIVELLEEHLNKVETLNNENEQSESPAFIEWQSNVESIFRRTFGENSYERKRFQNINYYPLMAFGDGDFYQLQKEYKRGLNSASAQIKSAISMLSKMGVPKTQAITKRVGTNITVNPSFYQSNTMSQKQSSEVSIEQLFSQTIKTIEENYGENQSKIAKEKLDLLKSDKNWKTVSEIVKFFVDMGKQAFLAAIPTITKILLEK